MRNADILQVAAIQAVQSGPYLCALAPFLKGIPASPDDAGGLPGRHGGLSQYCYRAHRSISWVLYLLIGCQGICERALLAPYIFLTGSLIFALPACWSP